MRKAFFWVTIASGALAAYIMYKRGSSLDDIASTGWGRDVRVWEQAVGHVQHARYRTEKIRAWIEQFPGAGPMVSAEVVSFSTLRRPALVMNSHHMRVAHRLGLTPRGDAERTEGLLMRLVPETWTADTLQQDHALFKIHGQTLCTFADPQCPKCPVLKLCRYGQRHVSPETSAASFR